MVVKGCLSCSLSTVITPFVSLLAFALIWGLFHHHVAILHLTILMLRSHHLLVWIIFFAWRKSMCKSLVVIFRCRGGTVSTWKEIKRSLRHFSYLARQHRKIEWTLNCASRWSLFTNFRRLHRLWFQERSLIDCTHCSLCCFLLTCKWHSTNPSYSRILEVLRHLHFGHKHHHQLWIHIHVHHIGCQHRVVHSRHVAKQWVLPHDIKRMQLLLVRLHIVWLWPLFFLIGSWVGVSQMTFGILFFLLLALSLCISLLGRFLVLIRLASSAWLFVVNRLRWRIPGRSNRVLVWTSHSVIFTATFILLGLVDCWLLWLKVMIFCWLSWGSPALTVR